VYIISWKFQTCWCEIWWSTFYNKCHWIWCYIKKEILEGR